ncbi:Gp19/Gp15/Gp42 family protein [Kocuria massiliensis]|uniref:Gp19/Gp15/Gp42 family protein n=1 Tax=Kocuria massiliensis TaxID=1926282 RepID=UPI0022B9BEE1|nr:Gp19/Gp15/Gp42 family protein [Kocuria massiliensis]
MTFQDVVDSYEGDIPEGDRDLIERRIEEAFRLLYGMCPVTRRRVEDDTVDRQLVADVVIRAILRLVRDDDPVFKSESENGYSYTKNSLTASGNLWFPDADLTALGCGRASAVGSAEVRTDRKFAYPHNRISPRVTRRGGWW